MRHGNFYEVLRFIKATLNDLPSVLVGPLFRCLPISNNKVVFSSFGGERFDSQPKAVYECLKLKKHSTNIDIVWILPNNENEIAKLHSLGIRTVPPRSIKAMYELATASVWIDNCRKYYWIKKRKGQMYIQTWHGPVCLKMVEKDAKLSPFYNKNAQQDSINADFIVSESQWRTTNIKKSFWYSGPIIEGTFDEIEKIKSRCSRVYDYYNLSDDIKIILYVPTFRVDNSIECYDLDYQKTIEACQKKFGDKYVLIKRLHPNVAKLDNKAGQCCNILNGTEYPSVEELIAASSIVISDYSGCIFDALRYDKIVMIYASDYEEYLEKDRGMYFDLKEMPVIFSKTTDELIKKIEKFEVEENSIARRKFVDELGYFSENAAVICADKILHFINKDKER